MQRCVFQKTSSEITLCPWPLGARGPGTSEGPTQRRRQVCARRGTPTPAVGQGNPTLQPGSPGPRHCLCARPLPAAHRGDVRRRAPCCDIPRINAGVLFAACLLVTSSTQTLAPRRPCCEPPGSSRTPRQGSASLPGPSPALALPTPARQWRELPPGSWGCPRAHPGSPQPSVTPWRVLSAVAKGWSKGRAGTGSRHPRAAVFQSDILRVIPTRDLHVGKAWGAGVQIGTGCVNPYSCTTQ